MKGANVVKPKTGAASGMGMGMGGAPAGVIVGRDGRSEQRVGLRMQEVARAFELLHDNDPASADKLLQMCDE
jgi:streptogramin lyase